ncbi:hypothetical protein [Chitinilyticum aquatile]|uniref:hypothetical protein n=1 Tax=Chitinilyticum aquatile TaxID=362520 RepID=UPI00041BA05E|nr:hypothetical protein [Chitinilyticum aquatile]
MKLLPCLLHCALVLCAGLLGQSAAAADDWGRLFYSPAERAAEHAPQTVDAPAQEIRQFSGEIRVSGGKRVRLINGQPSTASPPAHVRPGEAWDAQSGEVKNPIRVLVGP